MQCIMLSKYFNKLEIEKHSKLKEPYLGWKMEIV